MQNAETAIVTLSDGRSFEVIVKREMRCRVHGGQPGWGCESCRDFTTPIIEFKPKNGYIEDLDNVRQTP